MSKLYGHGHLIALRGDDGLLGYRWLAADTVSILLFVQPKLANEWLKEAGKHVTLPRLTPVLVNTLPEGVRATINPSDDISEVRRMMGRKVFLG